ncbi:LysR family transcriptional regulator [Aliikangiella sp. G2MR2-5]|uniref:LysR family transcriptional regulator n=1 Tax=Aliikangiella sp. G2MR2-5 TaxID=2788943 RepID=UPI0018A9192E|nr:LysR family transcriptional regulator [Aliikangiella sp. G2MR2-5]
MLNIDINLLRTFLEIEKTRHFGKAAENLYLTQSAISARIKLLEDTLGLALFERYRNNIQLTSHGQKLLPYATQMVELWVRTTQDIRVPVELNNLRIAAPSSIWSSKLASLPNFLFSNAPNLQLEVQSIDSNIISRRLLEHTTDIGFLYDQPKIDELEFRHAFSLKLAFYSNREEASLEEINDKNFVSIDLGLTFSEIQAKLLPNVGSPVFQAANWQMAIEYAIEFGGFTLLPAFLAKKRKKLFKLADSPTIEREVYLCRAKDLDKNSAKREFIDLFDSLAEKAFRL